MKLRWRTFGESEDNYRTLIEHSQQGIAVIQGAPLRFVFANSSWASIFGYTLKDLSAKEIESLVYPEDRAMFFERLAGRLKGKSVPLHYEIRGLRKDGTVIWLEFYVNQIEFNGQPAVQAVAIDRTRYKQAEQVLHTSLERYRSFVEVTEELGWTTNADGEVVEDTTSFRKFTGQTYEEVKGWGWSKALHPDDLERATQMWKEATRTKSKYETEYRLRRHDGVYRYFMARSVPVLEEDGSIREWVGTCIDITERKEAERELLIKNNAIASSIDGMAIADLQGNMTYVNPVFVKMWGYNSDKEVLGKSIAEMTQKGQSKEKADEIVKALRTKGGWTSEITATRKDGSKFYALLSASLVKDEAGKPICMLGSFVDITDRKKGEEALKESEERFRQLIEYAPDAIYTNDLQGNFLEGNRQAENLIGFKKEELVGKNILEIGVLPRRYAPKVMQDLMSNLQGRRTGPDEYELIRKDGTSVTAEISTFPIRREGKVEVIGIARDITERKKTEQTLKERERASKESEEKLRSIVETSSDQIFMLDRDYRFLSVNKTGADLFRMSPQEMVGRSISEVFPETVAAQFSKNIKNVFDTGKSMHIDEKMVVEGRESYSSTSLNPVRNDGRVIAVTGIVRDITERKQMEQKLEEYSRQLEEMVEHRTKQLKDTQERLVKSERLAAIGQVAAMVGHDLRNPLTGISGAAYYLKMKLGPETEKKMAQMLEIIEKDVQYSNKIITDLMDYSREIKVELTETTPKSIIAESISLIQIPEKVQLADSTLDEPKIKIDIDKMKRVFANFIKNAVEAMPQGGKLTISSRASGNDVEFMLMDSGVGMAKEVSEKIWTPFFTTKAKGMGLGLAICKRIIEAHQGKISVESIVGEGTTFTITIPIEPRTGVEGGERVWVNMPESLLSTTTKA